jgi:PIN domain nuclease of toxin-antitoxin system
VSHKTIERSSISVAILNRQYDRLTERLGAAHLPISTEHALAPGALEWEHRDPFDRALAAQAMREGVPLVTRDRAFAELPGLTVIW